MCIRSMVIPLATVLAVVLPLSVSTPAAHAETVPLEIQFTGLNFRLDASTLDIFDTTASNSARAGTNPSQSDRLNYVEFNVDGTTVHTDATNVYADLYVKDADEIPKAGGVATTGGNGGGSGGAFGFDLFGTSDTEPAWKIEMNITSLDVSLTNLYDVMYVVAMLGEVTSVVGQDLPPALNAIDTSQPVTLGIVSANVSNVQYSGDYLTAFTASGTGNITATLVPEPSALVGLLMGAMAVAVSLWVRRRA